jgi:hypothetical protein
MYIASFGHVVLANWTFANWKKFEAYLAVQTIAYANGFDTL